MKQQDDIVTYEGQSWRVTDYYAGYYTLESLISIEGRYLYRTVAEDELE